MLLLYNSTENADESLFDLLIEKDVFYEIMPYITSPTQQIRLLAMAISARVYRNRANAQSLFLKYNGDRLLIGLLKRDGDTDDILCILLEHIIDLVLDCEDMVVDYNMNRLITSNMKEVLEDIDINHRSLKVMELADDLFQMMPMLINEYC